MRKIHKDKIYTLQTHIQCKSYIFYFVFTLTLISRARICSVSQPLYTNEYAMVLSMKGYTVYSNHKLF